jgi:hypothetical protein
LVHACERAPTLQGDIHGNKKNLTAASATNVNASCHGSSQRPGNWFSRQRGWVLSVGAVIIGVAVALNQHWVALAALAPLLFVLPCAVMLIVCMKGMGHGPNDDVQAAKAPVGPDTTQK